jgi:tRNA uridine 5-carbamoylmethylation protein Kti12
MLKNIILVGIPTSGKSTIIKQLMTKYADLHVFSTDDEIQRMADEEGKTYNDLVQTHFGKARQAANKKLAQAQAENKTVIYDQTNLTDKKRRKTLGDEMNETLCICFLPPKDENEFKVILERNKTRPGKVIPVGIIINMMRSYELPVKSDGYFNIVYYTLDQKQVTENQAKTHFVEFSRFLKTFDKSVD